MKNWIVILTLLLAVFSFLKYSIADASSSEAKEMIEFSAVQDNKCQILSEGGKLSQVRNLHEHRRIKVRLFRLFGNVRQGGPVAFEIASREVLSLGCNRVDGREQRWELIKASFVD